MIAVGMILDRLGAVARTTGVPTGLRPAPAPREDDLQLRPARAAVVSAARRPGQDRARLVAPPRDGPASRSRRSPGREVWAVMISETAGSPTVRSTSQSRASRRVPGAVLSALAVTPRPAGVELPPLRFIWRRTRACAGRGASAPDPPSPSSPDSWTGPSRGGAAPARRAAPRRGPLGSRPAGRGVQAVGPIRYGPPGRILSRTLSARNVRRNDRFTCPEWERLARTPATRGRSTRGTDRLDSPGIPVTERSRHQRLGDAWGHCRLLHGAS